MQQPKDKKALLTGASGFLGNYLLNKLVETHDVVTLGRNLEKRDDHITADLKNEIPDLNKQSFSLVVHNAGKAHIVPKTKEEADDFFQVNLTGTKNLLQALNDLPKLPEAFIFISTVAVYGLEKGEDVNEEAPLLSKEPYGLSKIQAENLVTAWGKENHVKIGILRLPLVIGKNAPGNLGSMIKAIIKGYYFNIGRGSARRSMVLAEDVANILEKVAEVGGTYNLTDGINPTYGQISGEVGKRLKKKIRNMPVVFAKVLAFMLSIPENFLNIKLPFSSRVYKKMTSSLTFSDTKAQKKLNWNPNSVLENINKII